MIRHILVSLVIAATSVFAFSGVALAEVTTGAANLHQIDNSHVSATMTYVDSGNAGTGLKVDGTAQGLTPGQKYLSLFYDNGSKPSGPNACEPSPRDNITFPQMLIGFWTVHSDGTGEIHVTKTGASYVALDMVHSQSIRHVLRFPPTSGADVPVVACGEVHDIR